MFPITQNFKELFQVIIGRWQICNACSPLATEHFLKAGKLCRQRLARAWISVTLGVAGLLGPRHGTTAASPLGGAEAAGA